LQNFYFKSGVIKQPIGFTPINISYVDNNPDIRIKEIDIWLDHHPCEKWAVVDSMIDSNNEKFIKCDPTKGLTREEGDKISNILCE
jgi:hypothetical protein